MTARIKSLDHLVVTASDLKATIDFHTRVLGMERAEFGDGLHAVHFGGHKFKLHDASTDVSLKMRRILPGAEDFRLLADTPIADVKAHVESCGVEVEEGPVRWLGAADELESVYFRDPDGNLVEVANVVG